MNIKSRMLKGVGSTVFYSVRDGRAILYRQSRVFLPDCGHGVPATMQTASVVVMEEFRTPSKLWLPNLNRTYL